MSKALGGTRRLRTHRRGVHAGKLEGGEIAVTVETRLQASMRSIEGIPSGAYLTKHRRTWTTTG